LVIGSSHPSSLNYSPKHHKIATKANSSVKLVSGFNESNKLNGNKIKASENSPLITSSNVIKISSGIKTPKD
jgi:hypothetical protein